MNEESEHDKFTKSHDKDHKTEGESEGVLNTVFKAQGNAIKDSDILNDADCTNTKELLNGDIEASLKNGSQLKDEEDKDDIGTHEKRTELQTDEIINGMYNSTQKEEIKTKDIPRGILKNTASEPTIVVTTPPNPPVHSVSSDNFRLKKGRRKRFYYHNNTQSVQEFINPAFELDENVPSDFKLADIVEQALQQQVNKYQHPFGKGNLYSTVFLGEKPNAQAGGGRFILWFIVAFVLVAMAGIIIFMSEMYKTETASERNGTVT